MATRSSIALVGELDDTFHIVERIVGRFSADAVHIPEKRLLYMVAELTAGKARATPALSLFLFNLLGPFRYDWRDIVRRLRHADPDVAVVVLAASPTEETIDDAIRAGADELLYEAELSFPHLVWQRIGGLAEVATLTTAGASQGSERLSSSPPAIHPPSQVLAIDAADLRATSGRLDAIRIAERLGVPIARLAALVRVSRQALSQTPDSPGIQHGLDPIARTLHLLSASLNRDDQHKWLRTSREMLDRKTPLEAIMSGNASAVARMLESARETN